MPLYQARDSYHLLWLWATVLRAQNCRFISCPCLRGHGLLGLASAQSGSAGTHAYLETRLTTQQQEVWTVESMMYGKSTGLGGQKSGCH